MPRRTHGEGVRPPLQSGALAKSWGRVAPRRRDHQFVNGVVSMTNKQLEQEANREARQATRDTRRFERRENRVAPWLVRRLELLSPERQAAYRKANGIGELPTIPPSEPVPGPKSEPQSERSPRKRRRSTSEPLALELPPQAEEHDIGRALAHGRASGTGRRLRPKENAA